MRFSYSTFNDMRQYRHGDVLLVEVDSIQSSFKKSNTRLLAEGEGQNHGHIVEGELEVFEAEMSGEKEFMLDVKKDAKLKHLLIDSGVWTGEHHDIEIAPGKYRVVRQREYDPYADAVRRLND